MTTPDPEPTPTGRALLDAIEPRREAIVESFRALVEHESPSGDKPKLDALADAIVARFEAIGGRAWRVPTYVAGDHVLARFGPDRELEAGEGRGHALVVGHYDTVWPVGTLATMPFRLDGGKLHGPGLFDMKASVVMVEEAIRALAAVGLPLAKPLIVLFTSDEEVGSHTSRDLIEDLAARSAYTLVVEPPLETGGLKTGRKGNGVFHLTLGGRAAHAGVEPQKGRSAIVELARQILAIGEIARPEAGTTLNVGVIAGGLASNVVPAVATAEIDARITSAEEAARVEAAMHGLTSVDPDVTLTMVGRFNRPPMERTPAVAALFERVQSIGRTVGLALTEGSTGGASDANFTASLGVPTVDGFGPPGAGAHAAHEHILLDEIPGRIALLAACLAEL